MRLKLTLFLILLNLGVFYIIYHLEKTDSSTIQLSSENIFGTSIADIDYIEISGKQYIQPFTLKKQNNNWKITNPIDWPANLFAVQRIITQLQFIEPEISFSVSELENSGQTLEDFGLKDPNFSIKFHSENGSHSLSIGKPANLGNRIYVLSPDEEHILVVKESLLDSIGMNLEDLRNQQIFNIPIFELNALNINVLSPHNLKIRLTRQYNQWKFEAPIAVSANSTLVNNSISQLSAINVKQFILDPSTSAEQHGLLNPSMRITLQSNNQRQTLLIGNQDNKESSGQYHYARLEGNDTIFTLSAEPFLALRDAQEALREKHFIYFQENELQDITISSRNQVTNLQKLENNSWKILENDDQDQLQSLSADTPTVEKLLKSLKTLEAIEFVSDAPSSTDLKYFGFDDPLITIQLHGSSNPTLIIGKTNEKSNYLYAKLGNAPYVYHVSPSILDFVSAKSMHYKERLLDKIPDNASIKSIKLSHIESGTPIFDHALSIESFTEEETEAEKSNLSNLTSNLKNFTVKSYLLPNFTEKSTAAETNESPWTYKLEAVITIPGESTTQTLTKEYYLTERLGGQQQIAGSPEHNTTFYLTQDWIDILAHYTQHVTPTPLPANL